MKYNRNNQYALGGALSGAIGGVSSGASVGSMFGPVGTIVGGTVGAIAGLFKGNKAEDERDAALRKQRQREQNARLLAQEKQDRANLSLYDVNGIPEYNFFAKGGVIGNPDYEVEGQEIVQGAGIELDNQKDIASDITKAVGPSHENGGVGGQGGERVFSDRVEVSPFIRELLESQGVGKVKGKTYANVAEELGKKKAKYEKKLVSNFKPAIKTGERMLGRIDENLDLLFEMQESETKKDNDTKEYASGGILPYNKIDPRLNPNPVSTQANPIYANPMDYLTTAPAVGAAPALTGQITMPTTLGGQTGPIGSVGANNANAAKQARTEAFGRVGDFLTNNLGQIANLGNYLGNLNDISSMRTDVNPVLITPPQYNYRDRSETEKREIGRAVRQGVGALESSSRSVNASNVGNLISRGIDAANQVAQQEGYRRDRYDDNYASTILGIEAQNASAVNTANEMSRELYNQKHVFAPQQARTAFTQGVVANADNQLRNRNDQNRMALSFLINNENGVLERQAKSLGLTSSEMMRRLAYGRNILNK